MREEENDAVHVEKFYCAKLVIESIIYQIERYNFIYVWYLQDDISLYF